MVGAVIHEMLHGLPERILVHAEIDGLVLHNAIEVVLCNAADESEQPLGLGLPIFAESRGGLDGGIARNGSRRAALKTLEPHPFGAANMDKGVADGRKTGAWRTGELLVRNV